MRRVEIASKLVIWAMVWAFALDLLAKKHPDKAAMVKWRIAEWAHGLKWKHRYDMLPNWLKEAADVRGMKPGDPLFGRPISVAEAPIQETS